MRVEILLAFGIAIVALMMSISIVMMLLTCKLNGQFSTRIGKASREKTGPAGAD